MKKPRLLFVSTRFLYPVDSGGKIRTTQILRGMKENGHYEIVLVSPASTEEKTDFATELGEICDHFRSWSIPERGRAFELTRMRFLTDPLPIPIRTDQNQQGADLIAEELRSADVVVFDFLHAAVLAPDQIDKPSVLFTHNVEAEIFHRHISAAPNIVYRWIWQQQYRKMFDYENQAVKRFDVVVAVSERDSDKFKDDYGLERSFCIPTGVDLDFFAFRTPSRFDDVVFCGSMDWMANQDAIDYFLDSIWPIIHEQRPQTRFTIVGRNPPKRLLEKASAFDSKVLFTGFVDDVRDHIANAGVNVIPIRVGGGTRLKVYEAMAIGTPLVSTSIGVEGLPVEDGIDFLRADNAHEFAQATIELLDNPTVAIEMAQRARQAVETQFSYHHAARAFTEACIMSEQMHDVTRR